MKIFAKAGERVTRESGEHIATVLRDIKSGDMPRIADFDWAIERPPVGAPVPPYLPGESWIRGNFIGGADLHLARGWASETPQA